MPPIAHSKLGASSSKRWINCPGSVRECAPFPNISTVYADEGTAAHFLAEQCLRNDEWAASYIGQDICVPAESRDPFFSLPGGADEAELFGDSRVFTVDEEMSEAVQVYLDTIREVKSSNPGAEIRVEHKFHLAHLHPDLWGTCDCVIVLPFDRLIVVDYKHGRGVAVDATENTQAMMYALGAAVDEGIDTVEVVIVQPRAPHREGPVRRWTTSKVELEAWGQEVLLPAALATENPEAPLHAGDEHCKFCVAGAVCPAKREAALAEAGVAFDDGMFPVPVEQQPPLPDVRSMTPQQAARILSLRPMLKDFMTNVEDYVRGALETGRFQPGEDGLDLKLVQGNPGHRKFSSPKTAMGRLFPILRGKETEIKLLSPAQVQKRIEAGLKDGTVRQRDLGDLTPKQFVDTLVFRPEGKACLVPLSDPRPALSAQTPEDAFPDEPWPAEAACPLVAIAEVDPNDF